jgi:hypothetical protein
LQTRDGGHNRQINSIILAYAILATQMKLAATAYFILFQVVGSLELALSCFANPSPCQGAIRDVTQSP